MSPLAPAASLSAVVCAYTERRWDALCAAIESLRAQQPRPDEIVVVVDHNPGLFERTRARFGPDVRVVANSAARGLSGARNTGTIAATGALIAFLDDDATARAGWTARLLGWFTDPQVIGVGGAAHARWPGARPGWFPREFDWVVGCSYIGLPPVPSPVRNPIGCNMAFRKQILLDVGGFDDSLGRLGRIPLGCEETELSIRASRLVPHGHIMYDPALQIDHHVDTDRIHPRYYLSRCWGEGVSKALVKRRVGAESALASERAYVTSVLPRAVLRDLASPWTGWTRAGAVVAGLASTTAGYGYGLLRTAREDVPTQMVPRSPVLEGQLESLELT